LTGDVTLNTITIYNQTILSSSFNVSGHSLLRNQTTLLSSLNATNLNNTNINVSLYIAGLDILETFNTHGTGLSTLVHNF
jgi:hypothetical protein